MLNERTLPNLNYRLLEARAGNSEFITADSATETIEIVIKLIDKEIALLLGDSDMREVREQRRNGRKWRQVSLPFGVSKAQVKDAISRERALKGLKHRLETAFVASLDDWLSLTEEFRTPPRVKTSRPETA